MNSLLAQMIEAEASARGWKHYSVRQQLLPLSRFQQEGFNLGKSVGFISFIDLKPEVDYFDLNDILSKVLVAINGERIGGWKIGPIADNLFPASLYFYHDAVLKFENQLDLDLIAGDQTLKGDGLPLDYGAAGSNIRIEDTAIIYLTTIQEQC